MDPITFQDMFFSYYFCFKFSSVFNDTTLYWQGYFSSSLTLFAYKWCLGSGCLCRFFSLKRGDIIWFFTVREEKTQTVRLERLEKERLSLNTMHGWTQFEKQVGASLRKQDRLSGEVGWPGSKGNLWDQALGDLQWQWLCTEEKKPGHLHRSTFPCGAQCAAGVRHTCHKLKPSQATCHVQCSCYLDF